MKINNSHKNKERVTEHQSRLIFFRSRKKKHVRRKVNCGRAQRFDRIAAIVVGGLCRLVAARVGIQKGPYDPTTVTSIKSSLKNRLRILSSHFAIIPSHPVTKKRGRRPSSERDGRIYHLAVPVPPPPPPPKKIII